MEALKTPNAKKPLDAPPQLVRKAAISDGSSKVYLVVRGSGLIEAAFYSRASAESAAAAIRGGSVLTHVVRSVTKVDGKTTVLVEGGGFSEVIDVQDADVTDAAGAAIAH